MISEVIKIKFGDPVIYKIQVQGQLTNALRERFAGLQITIDENDSDATITLIGLVKDQAALSGILNSLYELHISIVSVHALNKS